VLSEATGLKRIGSTSSSTQPAVTGKMTATSVRFSVAGDA
jgi:hypothetical protein